MGYESSLDMVVEATFNEIDQCIRDFHSERAEKRWVWGTVQTIDKTLFTGLGVCDNPELKGATRSGERQWTITAFDVPAPEQAVFCIITASQIPGWINALGNVLSVNFWPDWTTGSSEKSAYVEPYKDYLNALLGEFQHRRMIKRFPQWLPEVEELPVDAQLGTKSSQPCSGRPRTMHTTIRRGKLAQFVAFLDEWMYSNRETTPLWWVDPSQRSRSYEAMTWWWVHVKQRYMKPRDDTFEESERWAGRGCITAFDVPCGIKITFELRGFPDPTLFWRSVDDWLEEMDRLGFTELSSDEPAEQELVEGSNGKRDVSANSSLASLRDQSLSEDTLAQVGRSELLLILDECFDQEDLHTLCFHLNVDYDNLRGEGKANKARELIRYLEHRRRIGDLVATIKRLRPDISWDSALGTAREVTIAKIDLLLSLDRWWQSIREYELSTGEMGSASEAGILPQDNRMAIQLENFRVSKIEAWPSLGEQTKNALNQAEEVFLGFMAKVYTSIYGHEVFGDQVPEEIMRNERVEEIIADNSPFHTFSECQESYRKLRSRLID